MQRLVVRLRCLAIHKIEVRREFRIGRALRGEDRLVL